jgi:hypothetical protein
MKNRPVLIIVLIAIALAIFAAFLASSHPDGLEKVAASLGFGGKATGTPGVFVDYQLPMFPLPALSSALAGIIGIIIIFFIFRSIARVRHLGELLKKLLKLR